MNPLSIELTNLDKPAQVTALKTLVNSCLARAIGAIRRELRAHKRLEKNAGAEADEFTRLDKAAAEHLVSDLDIRNNSDEDNRAGNTFGEGVDSDQPLTALQQAEKFMTVYRWAADILLNISFSKYDSPNTIDGMLNTMVTGASQGFSEEALDQLAGALRVDKHLLKLVKENSDRNDKDELITQLPEIKSYLEGMCGFDTDNALDTVECVTQHQLCVKIVQNLLQDLNAKNTKGLVYRIIKSGNLSQLGNVTFVREGAETLTKWVNAAEKKWRTELNEARDAGRTINTLD